MLLAEKELLARRGANVHSASILSRGRPLSRFTYCVRSSVSSVTLNPLGVVLIPLQSTILQKYLFLFHSVVNTTMNDIPKPFKTTLF